ncbi:MAG: ammonium transporter [Pseudomonadota bacterium]
MEEQIAELTAKIAALEEGAGWSTAVNMEVFYWWCTALMFIIHAGFLGYEMGASRKKNVLASGMKNILAFAFVLPTFFFVGWWIYLASPTGLPDFTAETGGAPWSEKMGPNLTDNASGIFWAAFALFSATTASIFSGAVIERIKLSGFIILAILLGSVVWILGASWAWHGDGWLLTEYGWHDFGAAGCVHMIAAFFALGVLINLGPRIGKFNADGTANEIRPHNIPLATFGLMVLIVGFFGFLGGCIIYNGTGQWTTIFGNPTTLSAVAFNTLMCFSGGIIGGWLAGRDPFWMMSGALAGIFAAASGLDVYWPPLAFLLGLCGGIIAPIGAKWLENTFKIDDAVGAVSVHGFAGAFGVVAFGIFAAGYPNGDYPDTNLLGQVIGAVAMALLGFIPGYVVSLVLKLVGLLRIPEHVEIMGMDLAEVPIAAYPEGMHTPFGDSTPKSTGGAVATPAE